MKTYKIHLIRNGMTKANAEGLYCGATDVPLSEEGEREIYSILEEYSYPYVDQLYVSPLSRARDTASIIFPENEQIVIDGLKDADFGIFENRSLEELKTDNEFQKFVAPKSNYIPESVEPPQEFYNRCRGAFTDIVDELLRTGVRSAAIVTHAAVIGNILSAVAYPKAAPYDWQCDCGFGYTLTIDPSLYMREPVAEVTAQIPVQNINELEEDFN